MKKILLLMLFFLYSNSYTFRNNALPSTLNELQTAKVVSFLKALVAPSIATGILLTNKQSITENFKNYPIVSIGTTLFCVNLIAESITKYQRINKTINLFMFSKNICKYILTAITVKNTMLELLTKNDFDEERFQEKITEDINLNFHELEMLIFEILSSSSHAISNLQLDINTDISERIYFLFRDKITIPQLIEIIDQEDKLYLQVELFAKNPTKNHDGICKILNQSIRQQLKHIFKHR